MPSPVNGLISDSASPASTPGPGPAPAGGWTAAGGGRATRSPSTGRCRAAAPPAGPAGSARLSGSPRSTSPYPTFARPSPIGKDQAYAGQRAVDVTMSCSGGPGSAGAYPRMASARCRSGFAGWPSARRTTDPAPSAPDHRPGGQLAVQHHPVGARPRPGGRCAGAAARRRPPPPPPAARRTPPGARCTPAGAAPGPPLRRPGRPGAAPAAGRSRRPRSVTPSSASTSSACAAMPSPHALSRGKSARSSSSTLAPARRAASAAAAPAGPAPTTTTSNSSPIAPLPPADATAPAPPRRSTCAAGIDRRDRRHPPSLPPARPRGPHRAALAAPGPRPSALIREGRCICSRACRPLPRIWGIVPWGAPS